ncbi:MAG: VTT domain-containing protein [Rubripirellula sp.]
MNELLNFDLDTAERVEILKQYFSDLGWWGPLVYVLFVVVEVVIAPVPGLMLYAPGGIVFGAFWGGTLTLIGNVLGAGLSATLMRSLGDNLLSRLLSSKKLERIQLTLERRGAILIFLLRLNPLTSSDVVSYAAGLTRIRISKIMLATACGMAPLSYGQAWLAESLLETFPLLLYPLVFACLVYGAVVIVVLVRTFSLRSDLDPHQR